MTTSFHAANLIRPVAEVFCHEFVANPYLCYTEHGQHALFYSSLLQALPPAQCHTNWNGHRVCVVQKESPTFPRV